MKRVLSLFMFLLASAACMAQFSTYIPVPVDLGPTYSTNPQRQQQRSRSSYYDVPFSVYQPVEVESRPLIDDIVKADVYYESSTGLKAHYILECGIYEPSDGEIYVTAIFFDKERTQSVHNGINKSGYQYYGGKIKIETDRYGEIISAQADVEITYGSHWRHYTISF